MGKYAVIGHSIEHSFSPTIHQANFDAKGTDDVYKILDIKPENLQFIHDIARRNALDGFNVTIPHKEKIIEFLDEVDEGAQKIGAVNTVSIINGRFVGHNTDITGYMHAFITHFGKQQRNVLIIGAGGAAKAVHRAHADRDDHVTVAARRKESFERFKETDFEAILIEDIKETAAYDVIINATPIGMKGEDVFETMDIPRTLVTENVLGVDLIYQPEKTEFLGYFNEHSYMNGLFMLVSQAMDAYKIWTGETGSYEAVNKKCKEYFGGKSWTN
ncbi:shikimate dehydrogenase [Salinicoccus albus]|uniref:shikimate dehydrogenase n=1 Tax=Salinicoccus albus TaxID=418756 RepID=UPI00037A684E|nr:shikimate dehydrogenase [Salinicoccus albus]